MKYILSLEDEKIELLLPLRFLLWSSTVLSAAETCKLSSMTSYPLPLHTGTLGSLDSYWSLASSERKSNKVMEQGISTQKFGFIHSIMSSIKDPLLQESKAGAHLKLISSLSPS